MTSPDTSLLLRHHRSPVLAPVKSRRITSAAISAGDGSACAGSGTFASAPSRTSTYRSGSCLDGEALQACDDALGQARQAELSAAQSRRGRQEAAEAIRVRRALGA